LKLNCIRLKKHIRGGINAQLWYDPELVKAETELIIPAIKAGDYVFSSDPILFSLRI
jgi:hypothetical protein